MLSQTKPRKPSAPRERPTAVDRSQNGSTRHGLSILSWLLFVLFSLISITIIQWRGAPHPILVGQRVEQPVTARIKFVFGDSAKTDEARHEARKNTPNIYIEKLDYLEVVRRQVRNLFDKTSIDVGLERWDSSTRVEDSKSKDEVLRDCIKKVGIEKWEKSIEKLFASIQKRGIVRDERFEVERLTTFIRVIDKGNLIESKTLLARGITIDFRHVVGETFFDVEEPYLSRLKELVTGLLVSELVPTLRYDPELTESGKDKAARQVKPVNSVYEAGAELIGTGAVARPKDIKILQAEAFEYYSSIPVRLFLTRNLGIAILVFTMTILGAVYLAQFHRQMLNSHWETFKLGVICLIALAAGKLIILFGSSILQTPLFIPVYLIPLPFFSAVIAIVYSPRMARVVTFMLAIFMAIMAGNDFNLLVMLVLASFVAIFLSSNIRERSKPMKIGLASGLTQLLASVSLTLISRQETWALWPEMRSGLLNGLIVGVALTVLLPAVEKVFNVVTDLTLLELSDQNHPLLRRLALEAPGSYQHSLMVAMLSEAGAEAIGANSLLARVGCYYHDIGKINKPQYFVENEDYTGSQHRKLNPSISTLIITSHTRDGITMAQEYNLPKAIIDFIPEHHGTTLIEFFYLQALSEEKGSEKIDESLYRYPGPKPQSRETGIALIADTCEAATRSLENPTPSRIRSLVHDLSMKKLLDGQLEECGLSFNELKKMEDSFVRNLTSFYHQRIKYPGNR